MKADEILTIAAQLVAGNRQATHGPKERNFSNIARAWNTYLKIVFPEIDITLTALDVGLMMALMKIVRAGQPWGRTNPDNYIDLAGYAGCAGEIALAEKDEEK